jgi:hypothetical protein
MILLSPGATFSPPLLLLSLFARAQRLLRAVARLLPRVLESAGNCGARRRHAARGGERRPAAATTRSWRHAVLRPPWRVAPAEDATTARRVAFLAGAVAGYRLWRREGRQSGAFGARRQLARGRGRGAGRAVA